MRGHLQKIAALFDDLADKAAEMKHTHAADADTVAQLERVGLNAKRGADIARSATTTEGEAGALR